MRTLVASCLLTVLLTVASCKRSVVPGTQNTANAGGSAVTDRTSSTPPFATKEPERYQATRVIKSGEGEESSDKPDSQTFIARDGDRRREDYESAGEKISYLQLPDAVYVLLPAKKLYAELKPDSEGLAGSASVPPDFSPDKLLSEGRPESRYERLGPENVNGRAAVKYRVSLNAKTAAGRQVSTESIIWVDENLGMPIRSETTSTGTGSEARVTMELRDIKETVDAGLFDVPSDFRKVGIKELLAQMSPTNSPAGKPE